MLHSNTRPVYIHREGDCAVMSSGSRKCSGKAWNSCSHSNTYLHFLLTDEKNYVSVVVTTGCQLWHHSTVLAL
jgi:hypothetical protein